jgi:hypothetical protein
VERHHLYAEKPLKVRPVPEKYKVTGENYMDISEGLGEDRSSRKGTPNPYAHHMQREKAKNQMKLYNAVQRHAMVQSQLQYINFEV